MITVLAKQLLSEISSHIPISTEDKEKHLSQLQVPLQQYLASAITKMDLVTRTEFDAQTRALKNAELQLNELQEQLKILEEKLEK